MILLVHPNPGLDRTFVIDGFAAGRTYRVAQVWAVAGGKGFNFARALHNLGGRILVVCPLGGHTGQRVYDLARAEGLEVDCVWMEGETRANLNILDLAGGRSTDLYESGVALSSAAWSEMRLKVERHLPNAARLVMCGSLAPGVPEGNVADLVRMAHEKGVPVCLDTYGAPLALALDEHPELVKINQHEAGELAGLAADTRESALEAAAAIRRRGAQAVIVTLGSLGAVGIDGEGRQFAWSSPQVVVVNAAGSGDAMLAGIIAGLARGLDLAAAARLGMAAGAANATSVPGGYFDLTTVENLLQEVKSL